MKRNIKLALAELEQEMEIIQKQDLEKYKGGSSSGNIDIPIDYSGNNPIDKCINNNSNITIYYKPESSGDVGSIVPGGKYCKEIDGIKIGDKVIKITNGYVNVSVNSDKSYNVIFDNIFLELYYKIMGGEISKSPDSSWDNLFNK